MKLWKRLIFGVVCGLFVGGLFMVAVPRVWGAMFCIGGWCVDQWPSDLGRSSIQGGRLCISNDCVNKSQLACGTEGGDVDGDGVCTNDDECVNDACARDSTNASNCLYNGCPEEAPTIYSIIGNDSYYDSTDRKIKWGVRGDEAEMTMSGAAYVLYNDGWHRPKNGDWVFSKGVNVCGYYQINLTAIPDSKRKNRTFTRGISVEDTTNICPRPSIHNAQYDSGQKKITFDVHGDDAKVKISGAGREWTYDNKGNGNWSGYSLSNPPACGDYIIAIEALNQSRHSGVVTATVNVNDSNICPAPVNGGWCDWGPCGAADCGGNGLRSRICGCPSPANGGSNCSGASIDTCSNGIPPVSCITKIPINDPITIGGPIQCLACGSCLTCNVSDFNMGAGGAGL